MKLWQKIFLWTLLTVMIAVSTTGIMILKNNYDTSIERQVNNTLSEHEYMISNLKNRIIAERLKSGVILLSTDDILNIMHDIFDNNDSKESTAVALYDTESWLLYQNAKMPENVELYDTIISSKGTYKLIVKEKSTHYLLIGSVITLEKRDFILLTATNIQKMYDMSKEQLNFTKYLSTVLSLACAFVLLILVKMLMRPLAKLNHTTHSIANGDYSKRIEIKGNDELSELAENMNVMADAVENKITLLQNTAENRKQFINNLSHEMKTPLTSILGFADIMRIKRNITAEELTEYSGIIFEEAKRLKNLSGKLMEIITVGETNLEFTEISTNELFGQMILVLMPIFSNNNMELVTEYDNAVINIDCELFKSMIFNIVDNAIKASKAKAHVYLSGKLIDNVYTFSIKDEGIGIAEDELDKILEPFYMIDKARSRKAGGAGLGLALCKRIADIHEASFEISSIPKKVTTVSISIKAGGVTNEITT